MILPNKYITTEYSLIGIGAILLDRLKTPKTVSSLWEEIRDESKINTFSRFIICLDFLFLIDALEIKEGLLHKKSGST